MLTDTAAIPVSTVTEISKAQRSTSATVARDIATVGAGSILATIFNTLLVFLIPRLVSVEDYGYWRLFLLYASYVGLLHLGFVDGALLRWAGRPLDEFRHELSASMKFLFVSAVRRNRPLLGHSRTCSAGQPPFCRRRCSWIRSTLQFELPAAIRAAECQNLQARCFRHSCAIWVTSGVCSAQATIESN